MTQWFTTNPEASPDDGFTRRALLKVGVLLGGTTAFTLWARPNARAIGPGRPDPEGKPSIFAPHYVLDRPENITYSTCLACHSACPVRISTEDGIVAKLDGSPFSPRIYPGTPPADAAAAARLRGPSCTRGQARLQNTHDPYRLVAGIQRVGERGQGAWKKVDIGAAMTELGTWLTQQQAAGQGQRVLIGLDPRQADRLPALAAFGRSTGINDLHLGHPAPWLPAGTELLTGVHGWMTHPHWERASGALIWGADPLSSGTNMVGDAAALGRLLQRRQGFPTVVVDPRLSEAATKAALWLPVKPGGDKALALMLTRAVMELMGRTPPDHWQASLVHRPIEDLEERAGLGWELAQNAARLLVEAGAGLAVQIGGGVGEQIGGADIVESILRLPALLGAMEGEGASLPIPTGPVLGSRPVDRLAELLDQDAKIDLLILTGDAGLTDTPHQSRILKALADPQRVGRLVVYTTAMNPVAHLADLVLPDLGEHERKGLVQRWDGSSLVQPAIQPVTAAKGVLEAPWSRGFEAGLEFLAKTLGSEFSAEQVVDQAIQGHPQADLLARTGWAPPAPAEAPVPVPLPLREDADMNPGEQRPGISGIPFRESFGGFVDCSAQYWGAPVLRRDNAPWIHPKTVEELLAGAEGAHGAGTHEVGTHGVKSGPKPFVHLTGSGNTVEIHPRITEAIRPGVLAFPLGYGHSEGYDGTVTVDGEPVPRDRRRYKGVDLGSVLSPEFRVEVQAELKADHQSLSEFFAGTGGTTERL